MKNFKNETGYAASGPHSMSRKDWKALLGLMNNAWDTKLKVNVEVIQTYLGGPMRNIKKRFRYNFDPLLGATISVL
ncbi:MAG: hypothetical protein P8M25_04625 [Paracoccaceae bacterium]|nr:hypothetical protein [Paracoccaceae bacterium]